jgi:uncharacterized protein with PQ loop repeat
VVILEIINGQNNEQIDLNSINLTKINLAKHKKNTGILPHHIKRAEVDAIAYVAIIIGVFFTVPQLYTILVNQSADNVSLMTWVAYTIMSAFWLVYGIERKLKPIIASSIIYLILDGIIVYAILTF